MQDRQKNVFLVLFHFLFNQWYFRNINSLPETQYMYLVFSLNFVFIFNFFYTLTESVTPTWHHDQNIQVADPDRFLKGDCEEWSGTISYSFTSKTYIHTKIKIRHTLYTILALFSFVFFHVLALFLNFWK